MACTIIRLVQAAVNLRRKFECAIQSSFDSMDGGETQEEEEPIDAANKKEPLEVLSTQVQKGSSNTLDEEQEGTNSSQSEVKEEKKRVESLFEFDDQKKENKFAPQNENESEANSMILEGKVLANKRRSKESPIFPPSNPIFETQPSKISNIVIYHPFVKIPSLNAIESETADSATSETDSDTICSIKSVRFRSGEAVSPSSGCKPAKLIRADHVTSLDLQQAPSSSYNQSNNTLIKPPIKNSLELSASAGITEEQRRKSSSSGSDSCSIGKENEENRRQWLSYSKWILKGQQSMEEEDEEEKENREQNLNVPRLELNSEEEEEEEEDEEEEEEKDEQEVLKSMEIEDDTDDDVELDPALFIDDDDDDTDHYEAEGENLFLEYLGEGIRAHDSLDEGYVDDFTSFEIDKGNTFEEVIYEEDEESVSDDESNELTGICYSSLLLPFSPEEDFLSSPSEEGTMNDINYEILFE